MRQEQINKNSNHKGIIGPKADNAFARIAAPELRTRVLLAHLADKVQKGANLLLGEPLSYLYANAWRHNIPGAKTLEHLGMPRTIAAHIIGKTNLVVNIDPRTLVQFTMHPPGTVRKPAKSAFIWNGDWDLYRIDLRNDYAIKLIRDLDKHRNDLTKTDKYKELIQRIQSGKPFKSHQEGVFLNTPERVIEYLKVYLYFLDNMAANGYEYSRAKDHPGVAISRDGRLLKTKRGAHRLAMAQHLGMTSIPVEVRYVHKIWWNKIINEALDKTHAIEGLRTAIQQAVPETEPGPLSP